MFRENYFLNSFNELPFLLSQNSHCFTFDDEEQEERKVCCCIIVCSPPGILGVRNNNFWILAVERHELFFTVQNGEREHSHFKAYLT